MGMKMSKKWLTALLIIESVIILFLVIYAKIQTNFALVVKEDRDYCEQESSILRREAEEQMRFAQETAAEARISQNKADLAVIEAEKQHRRADDLQKKLNDCR